MKAIHLKGCIQENRSEWRSRSIKKTTVLYLSIFGLFYPLFSISLYFLPLLYSSCGVISPSSSFLFLLSLYLSVLLLSVQPDRTLIDSVDATQFCTVQCTAILLQWTPVSWYIHKTPLRSEWNVPTGGRGALLGLIYSVGWLIPSFQQHGVDEGGGKCIDVKQCIIKTKIPQNGFILSKITVKHLIVRNTSCIFFRWCCWSFWILVSLPSHCSVTMGTAAVSASLSSTEAPFWLSGLSHLG